MQDENGMDGECKKNTVKGSVTSVAKKGRGVARCATLFTVSCLPKKTVPQVATLLVCKQKQLFQLHTILININ